MFETSEQKKRDEQSVTKKGFATSKFLDSDTSDTNQYESPESSTNSHSSKKDSSSHQVFDSINFSEDFDESTDESLNSSPIFSSQKKYSNISEDYSLYSKEIDSSSEKLDNKKSRPKNSTYLFEENQSESSFTKKDKEIQNKSSSTKEDIKTKKMIFVQEIDSELLEEFKPLITSKRTPISLVNTKQTYENVATQAGNGTASFSILNSYSENECGQTEYSQEDTKELLRQILRQNDEILQQLNGNCCCNECNCSCYPF